MTRAFDTTTTVAPSVTPAPYKNHRIRVSILPFWRQRVRYVVLTSAKMISAGWFAQNRVDLGDTFGERRFVADRFWTVEEGLFEPVWKILLFDDA